MKMIVGSTWNAKIIAYRAPSAPRAPVMMRGQASRSPSGPNTNEAPTLAKSSSRVMRSPRYLNVRCPHSFLRTRSAKTTCRLRPHITVFRSIALRLVDSTYAIPRISTAPATGCALGTPPKLASSTADERHGGAGRDDRQLPGRETPDTGLGFKLGCHPDSTLSAACRHATVPTTSGCGTGGAPPSSIACTASAAASPRPFPSR